MQLARGAWPAYPSQGSGSSAHSQRRRAFGSDHLGDMGNMRRRPAHLVGGAVETLFLSSAFAVRTSAAVSRSIWSSGGGITGSRGSSLACGALRRHGCRGPSSHCPGGLFSRNTTLFVHADEASRSSEGIFTSFFFELLIPCLVSDQTFLAAIFLFGTENTWGIVRGISPSSKLGGDPVS